jgi:hypothetical protein
MDMRAICDQRLADREEGMQIVRKSVEISQEDTVGAGNRQKTRRTSA